MELIAHGVWNEHSVAAPFLLVAMSHRLEALF